MPRTTYYPGGGPNFVVTPASLKWDEGHKINWATLTDQYQEDAFAITTTAQANAAATSITVAALAGIVPAGTVLYFGVSGDIAYVTTQAAAGATSLVVQALPNQIDSGGVAYFSASRPGKVLKAGTVMTLEGGYMIPRVLATTTTTIALSNTSPVVATLTAHGFLTGEKLHISGVAGQTNSNSIFTLVKIDADTFRLSGSTTNAAATGTPVGVRAAVGLLGSDAFENDRSASKSGRGLIIKGLIYSNLLPEAAATAFPTYIEELEFFRQFDFRTYVDNRS